MKRREIPRDPEVAEEMINELLEVVERQAEELRKLRHVLDKFVKHRFGQRSDRVDPEQLSLFYEELVEDGGGRGQGGGRRGGGEAPEEEGAREEEVAEGSSAGAASVRSSGCDREDQRSSDEPAR